jgi:hypothetical protein
MAAATAQGARSGYIASPASDWFFLIAAPLVAILAFVPFAALVPDAGSALRSSFMEGFIQVVIYAHLFLVVFASTPTDLRTHHPLRRDADRALRRRLHLGLGSRDRRAQQWWNVYHSAMQTFGIGRIYGSVPATISRPGASRSADDLLLSGAVWGRHIARSTCRRSRTSGGRLGLLHEHPGPRRGARAHAASVRDRDPFTISTSSATGGCRRRLPRLAQRLRSTSGVVSIGCWGFNSGEAFFVMPFFRDALFFIVWHMEDGAHAVPASRACPRPLPRARGLPRDRPRLRRGRQAPGRGRRSTLAARLAATLI